MELSVSHKWILSILAYDPTITEWDLYYWFTEAKPYPKELIKDESYIADYAKEEIQGMVLSWNKVGSVLPMVIWPKRRIDHWEYVLLSIKL